MMLKQTSLWPNKFHETHTRKVELVGRIKTEPPPCRKQRLCHRRNHPWRLMLSGSINRLKTLVLLMNIVHIRCGRWRRWWCRSMCCLPKWHSAKAPTFPIRPRLFTLHRHFPAGISPETATSGNWGLRIPPQVSNFVLCVRRVWRQIWATCNRKSPMWHLNVVKLEEHTKGCWVWPHTLFLI